MKYMVGGVYRKPLPIIKIFDWGVGSLRGLERRRVRIHDK
jgi:hypothetical protein